MRDMKIQILGSGCAKCEQLAANAAEAIARAGGEAEVEKVTDPNRIAQMGVMLTPALAIDGQVKSVGKVLSADEIAAFLN
jgi:small redox-active disulfide protein 2